MIRVVQMINEWLEGYVLSLMHKILPCICCEKDFTVFFSIILSKTCFLLFSV